MLMPGARLGPYEIVGKLGAGGMGEVWRARDTRLDREVALKVLPDGFADEPERHARFEREAKVLASLNHPNIAHLYGLEHLEVKVDSRQLTVDSPLTRPDRASGKSSPEPRTPSPAAERAARALHVLVMELVEGEDLAQRLERGPIPIDEAIPIARQIAEALEAAHEQGIVHRDLKPANVKVRPDGTVKVLDFGLAKSVEAIAASDPALSPTVTHAATQAGLILGTAAYMAPEQARGKAVDRRADIWAFGVVLLEMLTGRRLFAGHETAEVLAGVLRQEIDWSALPADTPADLRRLLARCLDRDPRNRLRDIGEARVVLSGGAAAAAPAQPAPAVQALQRAPAPRWRRIVTGAAIALAAGAITGAAVWQARAPAPPRVVRFAITLSSYQVTLRVARNMVAVSPDGARIAYVADRQLYLRGLADVEGRPIIGTEDAQTVMGPVFSPDGEAIAYYSWGEQAIRRIPAVGGTAATICAVEAPDGMSWDGDTLLFAQPAGVMRVSANGGTPELLVRAADGERMYGPQLLPGGRSLLFAVTAGGPWDQAGQVVVHSLASGKRAVVVDGGAADARYLSTGHIAFIRGGVVHALAIDAATLATHGAPMRVIEGVRRSEDSRAMDLSVSDTGTLVYVPGSVAGEGMKLAWFGRDGGIEPLGLPAGNYAQPRLSPDGTRIAMANVESADMAIWVADVSGATAARRLTFAGFDRSPVWSPDGTRITFQSERGTDRSLYWQRADGSGTPERLTHAENGVEHLPQSWSPDGDHLLFDESRDGVFSLRVYSPRDKTSRELLSEGSIAPSDATFSPDGRWFAYATKESSRAHARVFVQPFPPTGSRYLISTGDEDGHHAAWSRDGRELFYTPGPGNRLQRVAVTTAPAFQFSQAVTLPRRFTNAPPALPRMYDVARDGRFLGLIESGAIRTSGAPLSQIYVVLNWFEELKAKVPVR